MVKYGKISKLNILFRPFISNLALFFRVLVNLSISTYKRKNKMIKKLRTTQKYGLIIPYMIMILSFSLMFES